MLRGPGVWAGTGLSRAKVWSKVRAGTFPRPIELGVNSVGWQAAEIAAWLESSKRGDYGAQSGDPPL